MPAPSEILELVKRFEENIAAYNSDRYNETQLRREFIDPLFKAMAWDVDNRAGHAEAYKDVIHEDAIRVGGVMKAPDYCFRIGGARKFFVEAKKPSVDIGTDTAPAYQLRRYAWSAGLPLSILTNFAAFAVYDCRVKPDHADKPATARLLFIDFRDYAARWEEIAAVFNREAILRGAFDRYAEATRLKRGTAGVDEAFLKEIEGWRELLAKNIALRNPALSQRELNAAVTLTINRIIFLRICEDRGIETYGRLQALLNGTNVYARLVQHFREADDKYNSGLFHFRTEKDRPAPPDTLTLELVIDDKILKEIFRGLYYPDSPYEFSVLPADILGRVYEQFLGKVIRLTAGHQAKVEDKPEVKKAGGVFYTPQYIVDYIVEGTVSKLLAGRTPARADRLRILDPACGSGSFLIQVYQRLLDWYRDRYVEGGPEKRIRGRKPVLYQAAGGEWRLTAAERKRILLNCIYGVDIDPQAVEVTKLSLLLKVLEGENDETITSQLRLFQERALPDLSLNIRCGNSLIGTDFYEHTLPGLLDEDDRYRINVFDWEREFPEVFAAGGFDAVIGNPPYIFTRNEGIDAIQKKYFYHHYQHQSSQLNTFGIFLERCYKLLKKGGVLGFITPNNWLTIDSFSALRKFVLLSTRAVTFINILDRVFTAANVDTAITLFEKNDPTIVNIGEMKSQQELFSAQVNLSAIKSPHYIIQIGLLGDSLSQGLINKIENQSCKLGDLCRVSTGLKAYQIGKGKPLQTDYHKSNRVFHATSKRNDTYGKYLDGVDVSRYYLGWSGEYLSYGDWLAEPRRSVPFSAARILVRQIPAKPLYMVHGVFTDQSFFHDINSMVVFGPQGDISIKYFLGLINSRLISFWFQKIYDKLQRGIFPQFKVKELASFPIRPIDFNDPSDRERHDRMIALVTEMLTLHRQLAAARTAHEQENLQRRITVTDHLIDRMVYDLYNLTEEEIGIVEEKIAPTGHISYNSRNMKEE